VSVSAREWEGRACVQAPARQVWRRNMPARSECKRVAVCSPEGNLNLMPRRVIPQRPIWLRTHPRRERQLCERASPTKAGTQKRAAAKVSIDGSAVRGTGVCNASERQVPAGMLPAKTDMRSAKGLSVRRALAERPPCPASSQSQGLNPHPVAQRHARGGSNRGIAFPLAQQRGLLRRRVRGERRRPL